MSDESVDWNPIVAFSDDGSPSYVHGFEAGMIWQQMRSGAAEISATVHIENEGTLRAMCDAEGYDMEFTATEIDGWAGLNLTRRIRRGPLNVVK